MNRDYITNGMGRKVPKRTGCIIECTAPWGGYPVGLYHPDGVGNYKCDTGQVIELAWTKSKSKHFREVFYDHETGIVKPLFKEVTERVIVEKFPYLYLIAGLVIGATIASGIALIISHS